MLFTPLLVILCALALPHVCYLHSLVVAIALVAAFVAATLGGAGVGSLALL